MSNTDIPTTEFDKRGLRVTIVPTGGGCTALEVRGVMAAQAGRYVWITDNGGAQVPEADETTATVGLYEDDADDTEAVRYVTVHTDRGALLAAAAGMAADLLSNVR